MYSIFRTKEYQKVSSIDIKNKGHVPLAITSKPIPSHYEGLNVFIPNEEIKNETLNNFLQIYSKRTKASRDYWLLDVSNWNSVDELVKNELKSLPLDLDDDLYLFKKTEKEGIQVWELYEIHSSLPKQLLAYGSWNSSHGLKIMEPQKWIRRNNLEVI